MQSRNAQEASTGLLRRDGRYLLLAILSAIAAPFLLLFILARHFSRRPLVGVRCKWLGELPSEAAATATAQPAPILVHGVSLGETALMRPLVQPLERALGRPCLLTTTTDTGWQGLAKSFPQHRRAFLPFDVPWAVERFLSQTAPAAVILIEAEFWPLFLLACMRRGIPVVVVNARVSDRSFARMLPLRPLLVPLFRRYAAAAAQNGLYAARLRALGCTDAVACGSLKADLVSPASDEAIDAEGSRTGLRAGDNVLLLASTSADEERTLLAAWADRPQWRIIICPRHPERGPELERLCASRGLTAVRSSTGTLVTEQRQVLIVDEIGHLAALYGWCAREHGIAVVGGGFGSDRGGQNVLEAAGAGATCVVGWDMRNQRDSLLLLQRADAVAVCGAETLVGDLARLADDLPRRRALGQRAQLAWSDSRGASMRVLRVVTAAIRQRAP